MINVVKRRGGKGAVSRAQNFLREGTGVSGSIDDARLALSARTEEVRQRVYVRLDRELPAIDDPQVLGFMDRLRSTTEGRSARNKAAADAILKTIGGEADRGGPAKWSSVAWALRVNRSPGESSSASASRS